MATSDESRDFAFTNLTKGELAFGVQTRAREYMIWVLLEGSVSDKMSGITKSFTTGTDVPALKLTFRVAGIALDNQIQGIYDEVLGKFKLGLREKI